MKPVVHGKVQRQANRHGHVAHSHSPWPGVLPSLRVNPNANDLMSRAYQSFEYGVKDAEELLAHFDAINSNPPPANAEVLKRAGLVMALTAWETYVEDRVHRPRISLDLTNILLWPGQSRNTPRAKSLAQGKC